MSVKVESGLWRVKWHPKKASTAFTKDSFVDLVSGFIQPSTSSTATILGVYEGAAIDSSSTTTTEIPVLVPVSKGALVRATATGTLANTDEGGEFDLSDSVTVNKGASTNDPVVCDTFISATEGLFTINQSRLA